MVRLLEALVLSFSFAYRSHASSLAPSVLPLIVRNPYLSTWLPNAREEPWETWPMFWNGQSLGLSVLARTPDDRTVYPLLGRPQDTLKVADDTATSNAAYNVSRAIYRGAQYDASTTNLTYHVFLDGTAAPADITLSFVSPVTPTSTLRQSLPASYLTVYVVASFDLDIYVDVNAQWTSGSAFSSVTWALEKQKLGGSLDLATFTVRREEEKLFEETDDMAEWGTLFLTGPWDVPHACGPARELRERFANVRFPKSECSSGSGGISDDEPAMAFAKSFRIKDANGNVKKTHADHFTLTIGHVQDKVVQYASARGLTYMRPLWMSYFGSAFDMLTFHYLDRDNALELADDYAAKLESDSNAYLGQEYADLLALGARQVMGATTFSGTPENPLLFLKEISSNGNCQTVDIIFPAFPFFLYTSPRWLAYLLEPLLEHQLSGQYPNKYSMHDLGTHFPNMTGHADGKDEYMPLEECGNMLIMALALVQSLNYTDAVAAGSPWAAAGAKPDIKKRSVTERSPFSLDLPLRDPIWGGPEIGPPHAKQWLKRSYKLLQQWTSYLVEFSLEPHYQLSTDDFAGWIALHSNLALKGIVGIRAMSELASVLGYTSDAKHYLNISEVYAHKWQDFAVANDGTHVKLAYDWQGSWTTLYSLYADAVLCFHPSLTDEHRDGDNYAPQRIDQRPLFASGETASRAKDFIPHELYTNQSLFYSQILQRYGLPLDSRHRYAKSDWLFETAAVLAPEFEREIMHRHAKWVNNTKIDRPLSDLYETEEPDGGWGGGIRFFARAVVGGHWAGLTLERACGGKAKRGG